MQIAITRRRAFEMAVLGGVVTVVIAVIFNNTVGVRDSARDEAAQALARSALMIQRSHYYGVGEYADAEDLRNSESKLETTEVVAVQGKVYVRSEGFTTTLAASTPDGKCYWIRDVAGTASYATTSCTTEPTDPDFGATW